MNYDKLEDEIKEIRDKQAKLESRQNKLEKEQLELINRQKNTDYKLNSLSVDFKQDIQETKENIKELNKNILTLNSKIIYLLTIKNMNKSNDNKFDKNIDEKNNIFFDFLKDNNNIYKILIISLVVIIMVMLGQKIDLTTLLK